jgi:hypothetical protein
MSQRRATHQHRFLFPDFTKSIGSMDAESRQIPKQFLGASFQGLGSLECIKPSLRSLDKEHASGGLQLPTVSRVAPRRCTISGHSR